MLDELSMINVNSANENLVNLSKCVYCLNPLFRQALDLDQRRLKEHFKYEGNLKFRCSKYDEILEIYIECKVPKKKF